MADIGKPRPPKLATTCPITPCVSQDAYCCLFTKHCLWKWCQSRDHCYPM